MKDRRQIILAAMSDTISNFLSYDRKEDPELPRGSIEEAIFKKEITIEELTSLFQKQLNIAVFEHYAAAFIT